MNPNQPYRDRTQYVLINALLLLTALILAVAMNSCTSYNRFLKKYGHMGKDSVKVTVIDTVVVPYDSLTFTTVTDTIPVHQVSQQGRARLTFDRTKRTTSVKAECLPDTIKVPVEINCPPQAEFGIAPWYRWAFYITLGLLLVAIVSYVFLYKLKLSLAKR